MQKSRTYGFLSLFAATALVAILAGCGQKTESGAESTSASSTAASTAAATTAAAPVWTMPAGLTMGRARPPRRWMPPWPPRARCSSRPSSA